MKRSYSIVIALMLTIMLLSGCGKTTNDVADYSADVVVIGAGGAGLAAANTAADKGASVILLEKMPFAGGATLFAAGTITGTGTQLQARNGVEASAEEFQAVLESGAVYDYNPELVKAHAEYSGRAIDFMENLGVEFFEELEAVPFRHRTKEPNQSTFVDLAVEALKDKGGEVFLNTKAVEILKDSNGMVSGVKAENGEGEEIRIDAKAVIIATGDFSSNKEMLPEEYKTALSFGPVSSTGDGIVMAEAIGAATAGMDEVTYFGSAVESAAGIGDFTLGRVLCELGAIYVNTDGVRFSKDVMGANELAPLTLEQEQAGKFVWVVFDQKIKDELHGLGFPSVGSTWTADKEAAEIEKGENIVRAESIEELAEKASINADVLKTTIDVYNSYVEEEHDPEFNRETFTVPIVEGPYYAMIQRIGIYPTIGGLKINSDAQVLDTNGQPIDGLYAAGDVTNGVSTDGRDTLVPAMAFGIIAGENAADLVK